MKRAPNFDRLARPYRWMEGLTFGTALRRCRCTYLDQLQSVRNALLLGDGDGRFLARLLQQNPAVSVDAVDASRAMLQALVENAGPHSVRVRTHYADARQWDPRTAQYDLVVTHFFLDCLTTEEIAGLAARLRARLHPAARWIVSDFAIPDGWLGRLIAQPLVAGLYFCFNVLTGLRVGRLPNHHQALATANFVLQHESRSLGGLLVSEIWIPKPAAP